LELATLIEKANTMIPIRAQQAAGRMHWLASWVTPVVALVQKIISTSDPTDHADALEKLFRLDKAKVPKTDRMWFICPDAEQDLLAQARFTEAQNTGFARGLQVEKGRISSLYGDPVYVTNQIASVAGSVAGTVRKNMLVHKQALGIATQRNFKIVPLAKVQLSEAITGHILYGVKVVRSNHGVVVNSAVNADA